jgi:hypothetical protein
MRLSGGHALDYGVFRILTSMGANRGFESRSSRSLTRARGQDGEAQTSMGRCPG